MSKVISALGFGELVEDGTAEFPELVDGSLGTVAEQLFELRERQFDWIQIRRIRGQVAQLGAGRLDGFAYSSDLVAGEIVHHHDVASFQDRHQMLFDPGSEQLAVDAAFDREWSDKPLGPQGAQKSRRLPTSARSLVNQTRAERRATIGARHVGFSPGFVDENGFGRIDQLLRRTPRRALLDHIGAILLAGNQRLFFRD